MSDRAILVCMRIADARPGYVATEATVSNCSMCDSQIWVSHASMQQVSEHDESRLVCNRCFIPDETVKLEPPSKGVIEELIRHFKQHEKNPTDRFRGPTSEE